LNLCKDYYNLSKWINNIYFKNLFKKINCLWEN
jgi:hypothetical protein